SHACVSFLTPPAPTSIYTLYLHDALPICNSPNPVKGTYLWARTITSYTDGEEITTYNVSYNATDGQRGPQGPQGGTGTDGTGVRDRKSTRLNSSHVSISYAVFCLQKKN